MTLPNFLVVGAGRSGTTTLHHELQRHPGVLVPPRKAPSHFYAVDAAPVTDRARRRETRHFVADPAAYEALFDAWAGQRAVGEVSPAYLCSTRCAERIADRLPDARIVAIVRNPVERVFARFVARRRDGLEHRTTLAEVVDDERAGPFPADDAAGTYLAAGFVSPVLARYVALFPPERVLVHLHDDLRADAAAVLRSTFAFLGVDPERPAGPVAEHNPSRGPIAGPLRRALWTRTTIVRSALRPVVPRGLRDRAFALATAHVDDIALDHHTRAELDELYRDEVDRLGDLLGRDLGHWRRPAAP